MIPANRKSILREPTPGERRDLVDHVRQVLESPMYPAGSLGTFITSGRLPEGVGFAGARGEYGTGRIITFDKLGGVRLYRPSEAESRAHEDWHRYCSLHGYTANPGPEYPPAPSTLPHAGVWVGLTWAQVRHELQQADQLALEVAA